MDIEKNGLQSCGKGPAGSFTGTLRIAPLIAATSILLLLVAPASAPAQQTGGDADAAPPPASTARDTPSVKIARSGSRPSSTGPAENFTGSVRVEPLFAATESSRAAGASVSFEPGARSAWHTHPRGQVLLVTAGVGRVQQWGGPVEEIRQGDVVWTPPGVKHWHGAAPDSPMTHTAIQEHLDGKVVEWLEKVSDEQYGRPVAGSGDVKGGPTMSDEPEARSNPLGDIASAGSYRAMNERESIKVMVQP